MGAGPLGPHLAHALGFAQAAGWACGRSAWPPALDLGSGGGLPGLVLALALAGSGWTLLDSRRRSGAFLSEAVARLGLDGRVRVVLARAEDAGRDAVHRGRYGLVVARGFGPPAVTAECGAPLLEQGGRLVVSDPPEAAAGRWPAAGLASLGLRRVTTGGLAAGHFTVLAQVEPCPSRFPRRPGLASKRPLFHVERQLHT